MNKNTHNRRDFLKMSLGAALGSSSLFGVMASLQTAQAASNLQSRMGDYKALVCIFLKGGNDSMNMVVPLDDGGYDVYADARGSLAVAQEDLIPLSGTAYGMTPASTGFASLFEQNKLSVVSNVGTLIEPVTRSDLLAGRAQLPPQLFSHNDQQRLWMTGDAVGELGTGWAGRIADLLQSAGVANYPSLNFSYGPRDQMQLGINTQAYALASQGVETLNSGADLKHAGRTHTRYEQQFNLGRSHQHMLVREFARMQEHSFETGNAMSRVLANAPELSTTFTHFGNGSLAQQLATTARIIASQESLGAPRQIFFITTGSWDTHANQDESHSLLQQTLTTNLLEFQNELENLGVDDKVTTFTSSEFGRTLSSNGDGTDHGWGGHSFVMGTPVDGGKIFGQMPELALGGADDSGKGRIIPSISSDQYTATLARWFGLDEQELLTLFPRLSNFDAKDLGFMKSNDIG